MIARSPPLASPRQRCRSIRWPLCPIPTYTPHTHLHPSRCRSAILERQKEEMEEMNRRAVHQAILDALASSVKVEIPRSVLEEHAKGEYQSKLLDLQVRGGSG